VRTIPSRVLESAHNQSPHWSGFPINQIRNRPDLGTPSGLWFQTKCNICANSKGSIMDLQRFRFAYGSG
jgi:hypothetical protein